MIYFYSDFILISLYNNPTVLYISYIIQNHQASSTRKLYMKIIKWWNIYVVENRVLLTNYSSERRMHNCKAITSKFWTLYSFYEMLVILMMLIGSELNNNNYMILTN